MSLIYTHTNALETVNKGKEALEGLRNKAHSSINTKPFQKPLNQEIADWTKNLETKLEKDSKGHKALNTLEASDIKATEEQRRIAEDIVNQSQGIINEALQINSNNPNNTNNNNTAIQNTDLFIFASFSMGEKNLQTLIQSTQKYDGIVVMRGFKDGDIKATATALLKFAEKTGGGIAIDPTLFKEYNIKRVPTYVLTKPCNETLSSSQCKPQYDKLTGNVSPRFALEKFSTQGDLKEEAKARLLR